MTGIYLSKKLAMRVRHIELLLSLTEEIKLLIRYQNMKLRDIVSAISKNSAYIQLDFINEVDDRVCGESMDFHTAWSRYAVDNCLSAEENEILKNLGKGLGTSDIDGQNALLELTKKQLESRLKQAQEGYLQKGKMYRSVGALCGLGLGIMVM